MIVDVDVVNMGWTKLVTVPTPLLGVVTPKKVPGVIEKSWLVSPTTVIIPLPPSGIIAKRLLLGTVKSWAGWNGSAGAPTVTIPDTNC